MRKFHKISFITLGIFLLATSVFASGTWLGTDKVFKPDYRTYGLDDFNNFDDTLDNIYNKIWRDALINVVSEYEADKTGVTDSSTAFFDAIQAAAGNAVYVPPGTYDLSTISSKTFTQDIILVSDNREATILDGNDDQTIYPANGKKLSVEGITFQNFSTVFTSRAVTDTITSLNFHRSKITDGKCGFNLNCLVTYATITENIFSDLDEATASAALGVRLGTDLYADQDSMGKYIVSHNHFYNITTTANDESHAILLYGREAIVTDNTIDTVASGNGAACEGIYVKARYSTISYNTLVDASDASGGISGAISVKGVPRGTVTSPQGYSHNVIGNTVTFTTPAANLRGISIHTDDVIVALNTIEGADYAILTQDDFETENVAIVNNVIVNPGLYGIVAGDYGNGLKVDGNIIHNPGGAYVAADVSGINVASNNGNLLNASIQNNQIRVLSSTKATTTITAFYLYSAQTGSYGIKVDNNIVNVEGAVTPAVRGIRLEGMDGTNAWHDVSIQNNILVGCDTDYNIITGLSSSLDDWKIESYRPGAVGTMSGNETFGIADGRLFIKDPGAARNFNPTGYFPPLYQVTVINTANAAETITFDSTGLNEDLDQNERGIFVYDGSNWFKVYVGS